jgi:transcriptional regulator of aromatic amino acid metabolism
LVDDLLDASELRSIRLTRVDIDLRPGKNVMLLDGELQQPEQLDALRSVLAQLPGVRGMAGAEIITDGSPRIFTELVTELSPASGE